MQILHEITKDNFSWSFETIWNKLTSWLPNLEWLKHAFVIILIVIVLGIICIFTSMFCLVLPKNDHKA